MDTDTPLNRSTEREESSARVYESIHTNHTIDSTRDSERVDIQLDHNSRGYSAVDRGVNVQRAEAEFAELSKELSRASQHSRHLSKSQSRQKHETAADIEKAPSSEDSGEEPFDLERILRGNKSEADEAGIKSKRIGVVWDNLTVSGIGGVKNFVKVRITLSCVPVNGPG
jgi:hypothetical protein